MRINHYVLRRKNRSNNTNKHINNKEPEDKKRTTSRLFFPSLFLMVIRMVKWVSQYLATSFSFYSSFHLVTLEKYFTSFVLDVYKETCILFFLIYKSIVWFSFFLFYFSLHDHIRDHDVFYKQKARNEEKKTHD